MGKTIARCGNTGCVRELTDEMNNVTIKIKLKRVYDQAKPSDGYRVLVDRLWPRGVRKGDAKLDAWFKELAPNTELRKWFEHDPEKWPEFQRRYRAELYSKTQLLRKLIVEAAGKDVTLIYASREQRYNNVTVLKELLEELIRNNNHTQVTKP